MSSEKKQKTEHEDPLAPSDPLQDLTGFQFERTLLVEKGKINVLGSFAGKPDKAVVLFSRKGLSEEDITPLIRDCTLTREEQNTYYGFYKATQECSRRFAVTVIYPCQEWHIVKYTKQKIVLFRETFEIYKEVTEPYIDEHPASSVQWLYKLLEKTAEQDRLLLEDADPKTGFLMYAFKPTTEVKVDEPSSFTALVICNRRDLRSIRDLKQESLVLLENIRDKVTAFLSDELNMLPNEFRLFFHYKPTYYHLHVHVAHIEHEMHVQLKDYPLDEVIDLLKMTPDYFAHKTISYAIGVEDKLYKTFVKHREEKKQRIVQ